ncbi:prephenate dehydrogenase [Vagococcus bubulae]|uniref:prephenate dehydrogenase n=1 Tax=Vagococcus bubulae TaxID=1977868 RepID=UPI0022E12AC7|nr:prephenate dehydrogenase [Vagococcus bubulae]
MTQKKIMIIGLGLIGASLAKCIKNAHPNTFILGWDALDSTKLIAKKTGIVDDIPEDFDTGVCDSDVIILSTPVSVSIHYLNQLSTLTLKETVLVTDTGSTKQEIMSTAKEMPFDFIGSHPMAGSHKSGVTAADDNLFENAYFIFTNDLAIPRVNELKELFIGTRAKYVELTSSEHDEITAMLSHLPHIIASGLVNQADTFNQAHPRAKQLAAGGFRDITRIASSDPKMWTDILMSNRATLIEELDEWQGQMTQVKTWLQQKNVQEIYRFFERAKETRDQLPIHQKGTIPAFYDLFVDVPDKPGIIAEVTGLLGEDRLSIINLKILETREDIIGVLQVSFKNDHDLLKAKECIETQTDYTCRTQ